MKLKKRKQKQNLMNQKKINKEEIEAKSDEPKRK